MTPTMTSAVKDLQQPGETSTQAIHRLKTPQETMSECQHRLVREAATPTPPATNPPIGMDEPTASNITSTGFKATWTAPNSGTADNYDVIVKQGGTHITGSPFRMAGTTLSKTLSGLTADTEYTVAVTAINADGSATSPSLTVQTLA